MEAGAPHGIRPIAPCEARRIEAGIFNYNSDFTVENNPFEVTGLERLVEDQEADYVGKAALERIREPGSHPQARRHRGTRRSHRSSRSPRRGQRWLAGSASAGSPTWSGRRACSATSGTSGYRPNSPTQATIWRSSGSNGQRTPAKTAAIPFLDPHKHVPAA